MASKYNRRNILNGLVFLAVGTLAFYVGSQACYLIMEPYFINTSKIVEDLSNKYKFRIYDFAQAKKESHLKELRNELTSESANLFY